MPTKTAPVEPVFLIERGGRVTRFESRTHAVQELGWAWLAHNVSVNFGEARAAAGFILRTGTGQALTVYDLPNPCALFHHRLGVGVPRPSDWVSSHYAGAPVPGVSKRRGGDGYYRHPATTAERRQNAPVAPEEEPPARAARRSANLPCVYDDLRRSDAGVHCWKRQRKAQWKGSGPV